MLIISHRGAAGLATENSLAAVQAGLDSRAEMLELDVRVSLDGVPVLSHDPDSFRLSGQKHVIDDTNFKDLKTAFPSLTTLQDALSLINNQKPVILEVKPCARLEPIVAEIKRTLKESWTTDNIWLASFSQDVLVKLHQELPELTLVVNESWSSIRARRRAKQLKTRHISMNQKYLWWGFIRAMFRAGYQLNAYTVNRPAKAQKWQKHGLYAIFTDYPDI